MTMAQLIFQIFFYQLQLHHLHLGLGHPLFLPLTLVLELILRFEFLSLVEMRESSVVFKEEFDDPENVEVNHVLEPTFHGRHETMSEFVFPHHILEANVEEN